MNLLDRIGYGVLKHEDESDTAYYNRIKEVHKRNTDDFTSVLDNPCLIVPRAVYDKHESETRTSYYSRITNMEHIPRLIDEKKELDLKIAALSRFVTESPEFEGTSATEQADLTDQLYFMTQYAIVLERRLFKLSSPNV